MNRKRRGYILEYILYGLGILALLIFLVGTIISATASQSIGPIIMSIGLVVYTAVIFVVKFRIEK